MARIKQYMKDGRALRIETVVNDAYDFGCGRLLHDLDELQARDRDCNRRLLHAERAGALSTINQQIDQRISAARLPAAA